MFPGSTKIIPTPCPISGSTPATPRGSSSTASIRALTEDKSVISDVHSEGIINLHTSIALSFVSFNNALIGGLYRNVTYFKSSVAYIHIITSIYVQEDKYRGTIVYNSYMPNILCIFIIK